MTLKETAKIVLQLLDRGNYAVDGQAISIADEQAAAVMGTKLYTPDACEQLRSNDKRLVEPARVGSIEVVEGTTQAVGEDIARAMVPGEEHFALLNFASARNPGGGFLNGAKAQEEDLCRCSGLFPCLTKCTEYYHANREQSSLLYKDYAIFSPRVPFFRTCGTGPLLSKPFLASVLTAPAPNSRPFLRSQPDSGKLLRETFLRRWHNVLCIAANEGVTHLLLGAWGCGAFGGDPDVASETARQTIELRGDNLRRIVFAIPSSGRQSQLNLKSFQRTFGVLEA